MALLCCILSTTRSRRDPLINKLDTFELVRDKIAQILADEIAGQVSQAGANADAYRLHVYTERANPWDAWMFSEVEQIDPTPFVNVFYETDVFNRRSGNIVESQETEAVYNLDCYGLGIGAETLAGHLSADRRRAGVPQGRPFGAQHLNGGRVHLSGHQGAS